MSPRSGLCTEPDRSGNPCPSTGGHEFDGRWVCAMHLNALERKAAKRAAKS